MTPIVVLSGGGVKSAVAAARFAKDHEIILVHVNYGQGAAVREGAMLDQLSHTWPNSRVLRLTLPHMAQLRTGAAEPAVGVVSQAAKGIVGTPGAPGSASPAATRGLFPVLCSVGLQAALVHKAPQLIVGLTKADDAAHLGLPSAESHLDLRREFLHAFGIMVETLLRSRSPVKLEAPLIDLRYHEVFLLARRFQVPLEKTWTCDKPGAAPCRQCDSCRARAQACTQAGSSDPLLTPTPVESLARS